MAKDYSEIDQRLAREFRRFYGEYEDWIFDYEYPGYLVYYHKTEPYRVYFTPGLNRENEVAIQINRDDEVIDVEGVLFVSDEASDLFAIVKQYLDYMDMGSRGKGVLEWYPGPTWIPRREG